MLKLTDVSKYYGEKKVLTNISLEASGGICYGLVGPNGAGKSTLLKIITSIIPSYQGQVTLNERDSERMRSSIGYVPQDVCLEDTVSARDNLYFFGKLYGLRGIRLKNRADKILSKIGLTKEKNDKVKTFSGGMKRRLNIGCALMHEPPIIILDEPTVGVDPQSRQSIFELIRDLKQAGSLIIYASHYMEEVEVLCEKIAFIDHGMIIEQGYMNYLLQKYATPSIYLKGNKALAKIEQVDIEIENINGGYIFTGKDPIQIMEKIIHNSRENDYHIEHLEIVRPRLEDVFFSLTGNDLRNE